MNSSFSSPPPISLLKSEGSCWPERSLVNRRKTSVKRGVLLSETNGNAYLPNSAVALVLPSTHS